MVISFQNIKTMKKDYCKPAMRVVEMKHRCHILAGSGEKVNSIYTNMSGDDDFEYGGGSNGDGR